MDLKEFKFFPYIGLVEKLLGVFWSLSFAMVKYSFNAGWRGRDAAYNNALRALLGVLFPLAAALHAFRRKKGRGLPGSPQLRP